MDAALSRSSAIGALGAWRTVHRWSGLACTLFLLISALTGLPLIFSDEIEASTAPPAALRGPALAVAPNDLDGMIAAAAARYPHQMVRFVFFDDDERKIKVVMGPADVPDRSHDHPLVFDAASGVLVDEPLPAASRRGFMQTVNRLHTDLFGGFAGAMVLAAAGCVFLIATVSGIVLYAPYMKKLDFGTVRRRKRRLWWLDLHNLFGIAAAVWLLVVGATGVLNEFSKPLSAVWRAAEVKRFDNKGGVVLSRKQSRPAQEVLATVRRAMPGNNVTSIIFPSKTFNNPGHFLVWTNGDSPLTYRLFSAAFVDAGSGALASVSRMPMYLRLMQLSRPLHFGDYGGLPLKLLWACLDLIAIAVLVSGLFLSLCRGNVVFMPK
jgi:uncharacterized iron-regulated membrane protein